ncbi:MAG: RNA polymerase sigma factor [Flavobacteriales bacterium]|nr:RNA polymerase sigma factor [Flavobacteriales bacterium]
MKLSTDEIIEGCRKGKQLAQSELFRLHAPKLLGVCFRYVGSRELAEDLLQDTFVKIFANIHSYRGDGSFEGWMRIIAVNTCLSWIRKNKNLAREIELNQKHDRMFEEQEESEVFPITADVLMQQISTLPDGYRVVLNLFAIEGFSHKQISEKLGISESTSRSQYSRAKSFLSKKVMELIQK